MQNDTLWSRIKARRLQTNVYTLAAFLAIFIASTVLYALVPTGIGGEIFIATSTSLLATIFISFIDIYTQYKNFENKEFIDNLYRFGIHNLHFDKKKLLCELITDAKEEIWISGYRLILTKELIKELHDARSRGVNIRFLVCPPWTAAHQLIYDDLETSLDNYIHIIQALSSCADEAGAGTIETRFSAKPLFNDTYRVDDKLVTSPYMHNRDLTHGVISANDFFTYELDRSYRLYQLLEDEYGILWDACPWVLDEKSASKAVDELRSCALDCTYHDKVDIFRRHISRIEENDVQWWDEAGAAPRASQPALAAEKEDESEDDAS